MFPSIACPICGADVPAGAPRNLCPRCLMRLGLESGSQSLAGNGPAGTHLTVLDSIAGAMGTVPHVLLRDTAPGEEPGPIVTQPGEADTDRSIRYRIDGEIARGGMGAILKGRDPDLGRDVALKVLREDHRDNADMVRRFVEEAQIGGQLQHPGIVPIYELGTFRDLRPFFSMKLVKGQTLAQLLEWRKASPAIHKPEAPAKGLPEAPSLALQACEKPASELPRFLSIFEAVCQTVAYAHARGVIHRDLKPSNVMVGSFGEVQVMDWGLAKVLPRGGVVDDAQAGKREHEETLIATARSGSDESDLSHAGSILGTPSYMAPEQARGEIDQVNERADVFALGSILCEILTADPAFTGRSSAEIVRKASRGDLADALSRLDACGADVELVTLAKDCLQAELEDRPRTAATVAGRMTAYLAGVQERARKAERERAVAEAKAVEERKRRKLQLGLAACVLALTTAGGLGTTYYLQQRSARAAALDRVVREAMTLHDVAEKEPEKVERWEAVVAAWQKAEATLGPGSDPKAPGIVAAHLQDAQARADAARRDQKLLDDVAEVRSSKEDLGPTGADEAYARAFREAGIDVDSRPPEEAGAMLQSRPGSVVVAAAAALDDWALVRRDDRPKDELWRHPLEAARAADPDSFRDQVRSALLNPDEKVREKALEKLAIDPKAVDLPPASAVLLAAMLKDAGEAVKLLRQVVGRHPDDVWVNYLLARRLGNLKPAPREEQMRYYTAARAVRPDTSHELAHLLDRMGRTDEALAVFADLVARRPADARHLGCYGTCLKDHRRPGVAAVLARAVVAGREAIRLKPDYADAHFHLGVILCDVKHDYTWAEAEFRAAIRLKPDFAEPHVNLGIALTRQGKLYEAIAEFREAIRLKPDLAEPHVNLGHVLGRLGKLDEAIAECREAIRLKPDYALAHVNLGHVLGRLGKLDEAIAECREAIRLKPNYAEAHVNLGRALGQQGKLDEAIAEFREAIRLKPDLAEPHVNLGNVLGRLGKLDEAIAECREVIRLKPDLAEAHGSLGVILCDAKHDYTGAEAEFREAIRLKPDDAEAHCNLGHALRQLGDLAGALAELRKGHELGSKQPGWRYPSAQWVKDAERQLDLAKRLPAILKGNEHPRDNAERLTLAQMCYDTKRFATAARFWADVLAADPKLGDDRRMQHRYNAACAAALAAAGKDRDEPIPDEAARKKLRGQTLDWLNAELHAWAKFADGGDAQVRATIAPNLSHWKVDPDLVAIRDPAALAKLPDDERKAWQKLWSEVDALLQRAQVGRR